MPLVKVGARHQVTIPKEIVERIGIKPGDYVAIAYKNHQVVIVPASAREDDWFWSKEWQKKEREADEALARGDCKDFNTVEDLIRDLRS